MGTFNYQTSEYITMAIKPYDSTDFVTDDGLIDYDEISLCYDADYENAKHYIDKSDFRFFDLELKSGYYEGLQLIIEPDFDFYDYADKRDAQKEVTQLKKLLSALAGCGYKATVPFWVETWYNYNETLEKINEAVKQMRIDIKAAKTDYTMLHSKGGV